MYPISDERFQHRLEQIERIERFVENSKEYQETEQTIGLAMKELLSLVAEVNQGRAKVLVDYIVEGCMHKENLCRAEIVRLLEFIVIDE